MATAMVTEDLSPWISDGRILLSVKEEEKEVYEDEVYFSICKFMKRKEI